MSYLMLSTDTMTYRHNDASILTAGASKFTVDHVKNLCENAEGPTNAVVIMFMGLGYIGTGDSFVEAAKAARKAFNEHQFMDSEGLEAEPLPAHSHPDLDLIGRRYFDKSRGCDVEIKGYYAGHIVLRVFHPVPHYSEVYA